MFLNKISRQNRLIFSLINSRNFSVFQKAVLNPLPYAINGLEPVISQKLMEFHYGKHHQTYVNNLNALQE